MKHTPKKWAALALVLAMFQACTQQPPVVPPETGAKPTDEAATNVAETSKDTPKAAEPAEMIEAASDSSKAELNAEEKIATAEDLDPVEKLAAAPKTESASNGTKNPNGEATAKTDQTSEAGESASQKLAATAPKAKKQDQTKSAKATPEQAKPKAQTKSNKLTKSLENAEAKKKWHVFFISTSTYVNSDGRRFAKQAAEELKNLGGSMKILVKGFSDAKGHPQMNQVLSEQRAEAVIQELVALGVDRNRLVGIAMGDKQANRRASWSQRKWDRRVEIALVTSDQASVGEPAKRLADNS